MSTTATQTDISDRIGRVGHGAFVESQNIVDEMEASGRNVDDDNLTSCDVCGEIYATYPDLKRHVEQMHGRKRKFIHTDESNEKPKRMTDTQKEFWRLLIISDVCEEYDDEINENAKKYRDEHTNKVARKNVSERYVTGTT